jgi:hypothetical protein
VVSFPVGDGPTPPTGRAADPFAVVLGHTRSGTTMLRAMLDSHSQLAVPPESYFVDEALNCRTADDAVDLDRLAGLLAANKYFAEWQLPLDPVIAELRADPRVATAADAVAGLYAAYAAAHGKARYGDKTPSHLLLVDKLASAYPHARFAHIVRDGRDVTASLVTMDFGSQRFASAALGWRNRVMIGHRAGLALGPDRYRLVHYEDLVADPEATLTEVCAFFGLGFEPGMLRYHERADELLDGLRDTGHVQGIRRAPTVGVRDWRFDLTPHQVAVFDEVGGDALEALGYERSGLRRSRRAQLEALGAEARRFARRTRRVHLRRAQRRLRAVYRRACL